MSVLRQGIMHRCPASHIRPIERGWDNGDSVAFFKQSIINRNPLRGRKSRLVQRQARAILQAFADSLLHPGPEVRHVLFGLTGKNTCLEQEHAGIPEVIAFAQIGHGPRTIGLFHESRHLIGLCARNMRTATDIAVIAHRCGRTDAEGDQLALSCNVTSQRDRLAESGMIGDQMIASQHHHKRFGAETRQTIGDTGGNRGAGIAPHRLENQPRPACRIRQFCQIIMNQPALRLIGHHQQCACTGGYSPHPCLLEQRLRAEQLQKLFGALLGRQRPKPRPAPARQQQGNQWFSHAAPRSTRIIILETHDIGLVENITLLQFQNHQRHRAAIAHPMHRFERNMDMRALDNRRCLAIDLDLADTRNHQPVLGAVMMILQGQTVAGIHLHLLDRIARPRIKHEPPPPGAFTNLLVGIGIARRRAGHCVIIPVQNRQSDCVIHNTALVNFFRLNL